MKKKNVNRFIELSRIDAPKISLQERKNEFKEIYSKQEPQEVKQQAERCLECGNPYCQWKCPVHNYIPQWLKLAYEGRIIEAAELSHQTNSFPEIVVEFAHKSACVKVVVLLMMVLVPCLLVMLKIYY